MTVAHDDGRQDVGDDDQDDNDDQADDDDDPAITVAKVNALAAVLSTLLLVIGGIAKMLL